MNTTLRSIILALTTLAVCYAADAVITSPKNIKTDVAPLTKDRLRCADTLYKMIEIPSTLENSPSITVPRGDRAKPGIAYTFTIDVPSTVYLFVMMKNNANLPSEWKRTPLTAKWTTDGGKTIFSDAVYAQDLPAGTVAVPEHQGFSDASYAIPHLCVVVTK
ncbi:MAG: hypothetical protein AABZ39_15620 [Spirochaetota bacterium]